MKTSATTAEIAGALVGLGREIENPVKSQRVNAGQKRYSFAPLPDILEVVRPMLALHGLTIVQEASSDVPGMVGVTTRIFHSTGEWIEYEPLRLPAGNDAQSAGSAITYARRYALAAALCIAADDDDDGASASRRPTTNVPSESPPPRSAKTGPGAVTPAPLRAGAEGNRTAPASGGTAGAGGTAGGEGAGALSPALHEHEYVPKVNRPGKEICTVCGNLRDIADFTGGAS